MVTFHLCLDIGLILLLFDQLQHAQVVRIHLNLFCHLFQQRILPKETIFVSRHLSREALLDLAKLLLLRHLLLGRPVHDPAECVGNDISRARNMCSEVIIPAQFHE